MNHKQRKKQREKKYQELLIKYPQHARDYKAFVYREGYEKDIYGLTPKVDASIKDLFYITEYLDLLIDEEVFDLQCMFKEKLGKKKFKKLCKVFTK